MSGSGIVDGRFGEIGAIKLKNLATPESNAQAAAAGPSPIELEAFERLRAMRARDERPVTKYEPDLDGMMVRGKAIGFTYASIALGDLEPHPDLLRLLAEQFHEIERALKGISVHWHGQNLATFASSVLLGGMQAASVRVARIEAELAELRQLVTTKKGAK